MLERTRQYTFECTVKLVSAFAIKDKNGGTAIAPLRNSDIVALRSQYACLPADLKFLASSASSSAQMITIEGIDMRATRLGSITSWLCSYITTLLQLADTPSALPNYPSSFYSMPTPRQGRTRKSLDKATRSRILGSRWRQVGA